MNAAQLENVTKTYGRSKALDNLSFSIPQGSICGLIGPNGAGKTTAMGVLAGLLRPTSGKVDLLGRGPFTVQDHAGRIGIMPQDSMPSAHAPLIDSLRYYAELQGLDRPAAHQQADIWLERVRLTNKAKSKYGELSNGMRRRFSVAQAMLGEPQLVLLDEPTSGLDPELVIELRDLIVSMRGKSTILVSSHILSELESMCDYAVFLENGRCVRQGRMSEITGQNAVVRYRLASAPGEATLQSLLPDCVFSFKGNLLTVRAPGRLSVEELNAICLQSLLDQKIGIQEVIAGDSLESAYMESRQAKG
jgi:ABC-2 type transport system ATP-binding protein